MLFPIRWIANVANAISSEHIVQFLKQIRYKPACLNKDSKLCDTRTVIARNILHYLLYHRSGHSVHALGG